MFVDIADKRFSTEDISKNLSVELQACIWTVYKRAVELGGLEYKEPQPIVVRSSSGSKPVIVKSTGSMEISIELPKKKTKPNRYSLKLSNTNLKYYNTMDRLLITYDSKHDQYILSYEEEDLKPYGIM